MKKITQEQQVIEKRVKFLDYDRVTKMYEGMTKVNDSIW